MRSKAALACALQVDVAVIGRQALQQFAQHQGAAALRHVSLHIVQGIEVDHIQLVAAVARDRLGEARDVVEEQDVEVVFMGVQEQLGPVVLDEETVG